MSVSQYSSHQIVSQTLLDLLPDLEGQRLDDLHLLRDGWIDSLQVVQWIVFLEKEMGQSFALNEIKDIQVFDTIASVVRLVDNRRGAVSSPQAFDLRQMEEIRSLKAHLYKTSSRSCDLLVLGPSGCFDLHSRTATRFGYRSFNFSVDSGLPEDAFCALNFVLENNHVPLRTVVLGIDIVTFSKAWAPSSSLLESPDLGPFLDMPSDSPPAPQNTIVWEERSHQLDVIFRRGLNETLNYTFAPEFGDILYHDADRWTDVLRIADGSDRNSQYGMRMQNYTRLSAQRFDYLKRFLALCGERKIEVVLFLGTIHHQLHRFLIENTVYEQRRNELVTLLRRCESETVTFHDCTLVEGFRGDPEDFKNGAHIGPHNADKLFSFLLTERAKNRSC